MQFAEDQLKAISAASADWLNGKISDEQVSKTVESINSFCKLGDLSVPSASNQTITGVTGTVLCVIFYWRVTLNTPNNHNYAGNAGGIGSAGGGGIQGGALTGYPDLNTLYSTATSFQFSSAGPALNVNMFDGNSNLVGAFIGGGVGICLGTGGGSGSWS